MPIIKCKMCGGDIQLVEDKVHGIRDVKLGKNNDTGGSENNEI